MDDLEFRNCILKLRSLDYDTLTEAGAMPESVAPALTGTQIYNNEQWEKFRENPAMYFCRCDETRRRAFWSLIAPAVPTNLIQDISAGRRVIEDGKWVEA